MRKVRSNNTAPEIVFRKALWARGLRYRLHASHLPGKPDVVIPARKVAVFIDGDFWHGNQWRRRHLAALEDQFASSRRQQREYWLRKIRRTMQRDSEATAALLAAGWTVLRFWESDVRKDVDRCVQMTVDAATGVVDSTIAADSLIPPKTVAEFFAGIGLVRMGLERQGWTVTFANDIDPQKYRMYRTQYPDADEHFLLGDIHTIPATHVPTVTLATASFPCNDLSLAGSRHGLEGKESSAFWGFARLLNDMGERRPPFVLIENVTGFLTSHDGADFRQALLALNHIGYRVDTFILDAARFVPQSRLRLFIVGVLQDSRDAAQERQTQQPFYCDASDVRPRALADFILAHPDIDWAIRGLPAQPSHGKTLEDILDDDAMEGATLNQALLGFGDAVCAPALSWIAEYYLNPLVNEKIRGQVLRSMSYVVGRL